MAQLIRQCKGRIETEIVPAGTPVRNGISPVFQANSCLFAVEDWLLPAMPMTRDELFAMLEKLGIETQTLSHPPFFTVQESEATPLPLPGAHTKNLFLKDDKGNLVLLVLQSTAKADLKALGKKLGLGRLSFGKPDLLMECLGVRPGAVTAFAIVNDTRKRVRIVFGQELAAHRSINCHPLENTATTNIALEDLLRFIRATGHEPSFIDLSCG